mmetsp:Transcript_53267/g.105938  ORF Transcript_53267/g.105938 Transcript_53267/m.105938 type:complete len:117 (+) Transcript_53267:327-677(+)
MRTAAEAAQQRKRASGNTADYKPTPTPLTAQCQHARANRDADTSMPPTKRLKTHTCVCAYACICTCVHARTCICTCAVAASRPHLRDKFGLPHENVHVATAAGAYMHTPMHRGSQK